MLSGLTGSGTIVAHTSGAGGVGVLAPLVTQGCLPLAMHPAMTFTGSDQDVDRLSGTCFGITAADDVGYAIGESLTLEMGGEPFRVAEDSRALYHAALCHGGNHVVTVLNDALVALRAALPGRVGCAEAADPDGIAERVLGPLVRAAVENALQFGPAALTGPIARGDSAALTAHLTALGGVDPELADAYRADALRTARCARAAGDVASVLTR